jgi:hypothetical protein
MKRIIDAGVVEHKSEDSGVIVKKRSGEVIWKNENVAFVKEIKCRIPEKIIYIMNALDNAFSSDEFSIFSKGEYNKELSSIIISPDFFIPAQTVTGASVDYEEQPPEDYNVVIHKHPGSSSKSFSGTDDEYINQNFDISLLWCGKKFTYGHARVKSSFGNVLLPLDIIVPEPSYALPEEYKAKIKKKTIEVINFKNVKPSEMQRLLYGYGYEECMQGFGEGW